MTDQAARSTDPSPPILHPFLLALYPVLALLGVNAFEIQLDDGVRALAAALLFATVLTLVARLAAPDWQRAGLLASLWLVLFFAYGHLYNLVGETLIGRHRILLPIWGVAVLLGSYWILKRIGDPIRATNPANIVSGFLFLLSLGQIALAEMNQVKPLEEFLPDELVQMQLPPSRPPDIFYIIMDGYARKDALAEDIHLDNSEFLTRMEALGFYVAACSQSNYAQTKLSVSSTLNMDYLESYYPDVDPLRTESHGLEPFLTHSLVRRALERLGYVTFAFETGFDWTELRDADYYLGQDTDRGLNAFEVLLLRSTAALALTDAAATFPEFLAVNLSNPDLIHRERVSYILETLPNLPDTESPKFVFAHIVSPHPPYIFDREGNLPAPNGNETALYRDQIIYLNSRLEDVIAEILTEAEIPPMIVIQGDHGAPVSSDSGRMRILNLYLIPDNGLASLYPTISPVNTFRVIFSSSFESRQPLIEDRSYFSHYQHPFAFQEIPNDDSDCLTS